MLAQCSRRSADIDPPLVQAHEGRWGFRATVAREWSAIGLFPVFPENSKHWHNVSLRLLGQPTSPEKPQQIHESRPIAYRYKPTSLAFAYR